MEPEAMMTAAGFLAQRADNLGQELQSIQQQWSDLSSTWTGKAASAYEPSWDEWHDNARTVMAILQEHADLLKQSAAVLVKHEHNAAAAMRSLTPKGDVS